MGLAEKKLDSKRLKKTFKTPKQRARDFLIQALYQWQLCGENPRIIEAQLLDTKTKIARQFFIKTWRGITNKEEFEAIRGVIVPHLPNDIDSISLVDLSVVYLGVYELRHHHSLSHSIILNEAIELTKRFGTQEGYRFVNYLLDTISKEISPNTVFKT